MIVIFNIELCLLKPTPKDQYQDTICTPFKVILVARKFFKIQFLKYLFGKYNILKSK